MDKKVVVVLPAFNCEQTLGKVLSDIPWGAVDDIVLVDDSSSDKTVRVARSLGVENVYVHDTNRGYGANQKTCYTKALELGADLIIMLHPDYQYDPKLIPDIIAQFDNGADVVFASRMSHGFDAVRLGMPFYKYLANRFLTLLQNIVLSLHLSEYHTGYRAFSSNVLRQIDYMGLDDDFIFDNEIIIEMHVLGFHISEIYCPAKYDEDASSINLRKSIRYGIGVLKNTFKYLIDKKWHII